MPIIYNNHTHIFNVECIPDKFIKWKMIRLMSNNRVTLHLFRFLTAFRYQNDFLKKQSSFLQYHTDDWQESIFKKLQGIYPAGTRFVVLTLDMDYMGAGQAERTFITQATEVANLKRMYPNELLPFICIDPRRGTGKENAAFVKKWIEKHGYVGIKMYPPLGFFPFDERLMPVYEYACEKRIPVLTHCYKDGGIFYKGEIKKEWLDPLPGRVGPFKDEKMLYFRNNFMQPANYAPVLEKFPDLKICFAHYGGHAEMLSAKTDNWYKQIKVLKNVFKNVYTDIAYTLYNKDTFRAIKEDIDVENGARILFGTDFYMTERKMSEHKLKDNLRWHIGEEAFEKISYHNVKRFLDSEIYPFAG
jgi:uncharacterized protein